MPHYELIFIGLLGLVIGSFLNVVIYRLPVILHREWRNQCQALPKMQNPDKLPGLDAPGRFNLIYPFSQCPSCLRRIRPWDNIPVLSYLWLRGRCRGCQQTIACRYPLIECLTALLSLITFHHFGLTLAGLLSLLLTWSLIAQAFIDFDHQLLPDDITLPILWLGLLVNIKSVFVSPSEAIIGACIGYLSLWSIYWLFKIVTGKEGMGHGDFKLLALFGAWLGWQALPAIILLSAGTGAIIGILLIVLKKHDKNQPMPFGPFIALAGWIVLLWGDKLNQNYLRLVGLN